jgi:hypothetical protein
METENQKAELENIKMLSLEEKRIALEEIAAKHEGKHSPDIIVAEAFDKNNKLHECFNWDNDSAGHQYRLDQARALIRVVRIHITTTRRRIDSIAYVRDPAASPHEQGYVSIITVKKSHTDALAVLEAELSRVQSLIDRARDIAETLGLEKEFWERLREMIGIKPPRQKAA